MSVRCVVPARPPWRLQPALTLAHATHATDAGHKRGEKNFLLKSLWPQFAKLDSKY